MTEDTNEVRILRGDSQTWQELNNLSGEDRRGAEFGWFGAGHLATLNPNEADGARIGKMYQSFLEEVGKTVQSGMPFQLAIEPRFLGNSVESSARARLLEVDVRIEPNDGAVTLAELKGITAKVRGNIKAASAK